MYFVSPGQKPSKHPLPFWLKLVFGVWHSCRFGLAPQATSLSEQPHTFGMATVVLPATFSGTLQEAFRGMDMIKQESMVLVFGDIDRENNEVQVTDVYAPHQTGTETSVTLTTRGEQDVTDWIQGHPGKKMVGWAHSHHDLTCVPSVTDIQNQYSYQRLEQSFFMMICNLADGMRVWRLSDETMSAMATSGGIAPEGADTTTLLGDVTTKEGGQLLFWAPPGVCHENMARLAKKDRIEMLAERVEESEDRNNSLEDRVESSEDRIESLEEIVRNLTDKGAEQHAMIVHLSMKLAKMQPEGGSQSRGSGEEVGEAAGPKRPPSAFALYTKAERPSLKGSAAQQSKQASAKWKELPEEEKKAYVDEAADLQDEYRKHPQKKPKRQ